MTERPASCKACGGGGKLNQIAIADSTWVWVHSSCERVYTGSTLSPEPRASKRFFAHPLMRELRGGPIGGVGYIRDAALTDSLGWMRITQPSTST
jgi:hypothetical protein